MSEKPDANKTQNIPDPVYTSLFPTQITERLVAEKATRIRGVLAPPRISRNKNLYLPEELKRGDGKTVPLFWEHDYTVPQIGMAHLHWNDELMRLEYDAEVTDEGKAALVKSGGVNNVSLGAHPSRFDHFDGYNVPRELDFYEASLTCAPGIPETSVEVIEHVSLTQSSPVPSGEGAASQPEKTEKGHIQTASEAQKPDDVADETQPASATSVVAEREWDAAYINNLPDNAFAAVYPAGERDESGKTAPKASRHLPHHNTAGEVDLPHLRNALQRLDQTDLPTDAKVKARQHLLHHAKEMGVGGASEESTIDKTKEKEKEKEKKMSEKEQKTEEKKEEQPAVEKKEQQQQQQLQAYVTTKDLDAALTKERESIIAAFKEHAGSLREKEKEKQGPSAKVSSTEQSAGGEKSKEPWEVEAEKYLKIAQAIIAESGLAKPIGFTWTVPIIDLPNGVDERLSWLRSFEPGVKKVTEAISTGTTGTALSVTGAPPLRIIPSALASQLRDTVRFVTVPKGADRVRFGTVKVAAAGALTENTEPTEVSPTLSTVDAVPSPRGLQLSVSYELEAKSIGNIIQAVTETFRLSELYDEDNLILTEADTATPAATLYGDESVVAEGNITSAMTFAPARIASAIKNITNKGYDPADLVAVLHPVQFDALLKHSDVRQAHIFGEKTQITGVIPSVYGVEVRRSTKVPTGTGSGTTTTYRAAVYKKGITFGLGVSKDMQIKTFDDIRKNQNVIKAVWDMACKAVEPDSLVKIVTA